MRVFFTGQQGETASTGYPARVSRPDVPNKKRRNLMKCYTAIGGVIASGIRLRMDPPSTPDGKARYFVHVNPDHFGEVLSIDALLSSGCAHVEGDDVVVDRCTYVGGDLQPEFMPDGNALVLGIIDQRLADFGGF